MIEQTIQRAQVYYFLSHAFLYPQTSWLEQLPDALRIMQSLGMQDEFNAANAMEDHDLPALQTQHRLAFGLTGSQCYETEFGLPHEFRQSQELADIAGFYRAFGLQTGAAVRERPDHLATELEFMYLLMLKEAYAATNSMPEQAEICIDAQRKFLQDHLARWIGPFCRSLERSIDERLGKDSLQSPYVTLARLAEAFISAEAARLGVIPAIQPAAEVKPTPYNPDYSCAGCAVAETNL
jgi:nitrate reductase assembly molybdenum cofactor insertion protein NarJ